jgi:hypothetical protein
MNVANRVFCFLGPFPSPPDPVKFELLQLSGRSTDTLTAPTIDVVVVDNPASEHAERGRRRGCEVITLQQLVEFLVTMAPAHRVKQLDRTLRARSGPDSPGMLAAALDRADPVRGETIVELVRQAQSNDVIVHLEEAGGAAGGMAEDAWLLAWCSDADGCEFFAVPDAEARRARLDAVSGACFADGSDVAAAELEILVRVLAGMTGVGSGTPAEAAAALFDGWKSELGVSEAAISGPGDLVPWIAWLEPYQLSKIEEVARPFRGIVAINQAM